jgi:GntR family transcriptional regulator, rspAB operon transcriptional repressor
VLKESLRRAEAGRANRDVEAEEAARVSLRDQAYEAIKDRIITCAFSPGEAINEIGVAELLGLGRTPVHQALERLRLEGMVEVIPRKGVIVKPLVLRDVMEMIEVRLVNECYCARMAAVRASDQDLRELSLILKRARRAIAAHDSTLLMSLDREFHMALARAARNEDLSDILAKFHARSLRFWFISFTTEHHLSFQRQHEAILGAVEDRDEAAADEAMRAHIEAFRASVSSHLRRNAPQTPPG